MAGIGRKIGPTPNNQIKNAEAQNATNLSNSQAQQVSSTQPAQKVVQKVVQQTAQQNQTKNQSNPLITGILTQLKSISSILNQIKNNQQKDKPAQTPVGLSKTELSPDSIANLVRSLSVENLDAINQKLTRIDNVLSNTDFSSTNTQLTAFTESISNFTNKLAESQKTGSSSSGISATEYNAKIDTSNIESAFNNFANRLEEIFNIAKGNSKQLDQSVFESSRGENDASKIETNNILSSIRENMVNLNKGISDMQSQFSSINAQTQRFYSQTENEWKRKRQYDVDLRDINYSKQEKLLNSINESRIGDIDKILSRKNLEDPQSRLDKAISDLKESINRQKEAQETNMGAASNADNNLIKFMDNWMVNKAQSAVNYAMGGGIVKYFKNRSAKKAEDNAVEAGRQAESEIIRANASNATLEMRQERTAIPERPNANLAVQDQFTSPSTATGVMAPADGAITRAQNNIMNAIMLRNSAIDTFAESKEGKRNNLSASTIKSEDSILIKLEAQLVQLTLIRAALQEESADRKRAEREAELREALAEGTEEDNSIQLVPIEKETEKKETPEKEEKKSGGLLGLILGGLGTLLLGGTGLFGKIIGWLAKEGLELLGSAFKVLLDLAVKYGPRLFGLLWDAGAWIFKKAMPLLKDVGTWLIGHIWGFVKNGWNLLTGGIGKVVNFITNGLGKALGGLFKGGGKLIGSLLGKVAPILGPVGAAASVALIGWEIGKLLGSWLKIDKVMDKMFGNDKAEQYNDNYTAQMKKQAEDQNKNRAIATASWEDQAAQIKDKEKRGGTLSTTEQAILKASSDKNVITRGDRTKAVMGAVNDAGENLNQDDVSAAMQFIDTSMNQVEKESLEQYQKTVKQFDDLSKEVYKHTGLFYNESFKTLLKVNTLEATERALKMVSDEITRLNQKVADAWFFTSGIIVEIDKLLLVKNSLIQKKKILKEKENLAKSKAELEEMKKTAKAAPPPPPPKIDKEEEKEDSKPTLAEVTKTASDEEKITPAPNETNKEADLPKAIAKEIDISEVNEINKEEFLNNLVVEGYENNKALQQAFRSYVETGISINKKMAGNKWSDESMWRDFYKAYRDNWLKYFYGNKEVLAFRGDSSTKADKISYDKFITSAEKAQLLADLKPEIKPDSMLDEDEPIMISADMTDNGEKLTNARREELNFEESDRYNDELAQYELEKSAYEEMKNNATIDNDENLKNAFDSYVSYVIGDENLGGTTASRRKMAETNWKDAYAKGMVLVAGANGYMALSKDEFFGKFYDQPVKPEPPKYYELDENEVNVDEESEFGDEEIMEGQAETGESMPAIDVPEYNEKSTEMNFSDDPDLNESLNNAYHNFQNNYWKFDNKIANAEEASKLWLDQLKQGAIISYNNGQFSMVPISEFTALHSSVSSGESVPQLESITSGENMNDVREIMNALKTAEASAAATKSSTENMTAKSMEEAAKASMAIAASTTALINPASPANIANTIAKEVNKAAGLKEVVVYQSTKAKGVTVIED